MLSPATEVDIDFPEKLGFLFEPWRYKVAYGGRGAAKSWGFARALLVKGLHQKLRILCTREYQNSIAESVHKLLATQIEEMGLSGHYEVQEKRILGSNGTEFIFEGLRYNVGKIKSFESIDIVWVEEAQMVSKSSWSTLVPTIRKDGSEIWVTFNPELEADETYQRFVAKPPTNAKVVKINWNDNPWFPKVLRDEMDELRARDPDEHLVVWEGHCRQALVGAVYAKEIRTATEEGRITRVPYDRTKPVSTYWDLGRSDSTSIWFAQARGLGELAIVDFLQDNAKAIGAYIKEIQNRPYVYDTHWMPHDAESERIEAEKTVAGQARAAGMNVQIVPRIGLVLGIDAARTLFGQCWFDTDKCADGLHALRHYRYEKDDERQTFRKEPRHDWASHAADAFRYMAVAWKEPQAGRERRARRGAGGSLGWMG